MTTINLDTDSLTLTIQEAGESNTNSNAGSAAELVKTKVGVDTPIRTIRGGTNITVNENTDELEIVNDLSFGSVNSILKPNADDSLSIGSLSRQWTDLYLVNYRIQNANNRIEIDADTEVLIETTDQAYEIDTGAADLTLRTDASNNVSIPSNLVINGNLTVLGDTTTLSTTNTTMTDRIIELANGATVGGDSGIIIERGSSGNNATIFWDESEDRFHIATTTSTGSESGDMDSVADADLKMGSVEIGTLTANGTGEHTVTRTSAAYDDIIFSVMKQGTDSSIPYGDDAGFAMKYTNGTDEATVGGFLAYAPNADDRRMYIMAADNGDTLRTMQYWQKEYDADFDGGAGATFNRSQLKANLEIAAFVDDSPMLKLKRESGNNTDYVSIQFEHYNDDSEIQTRLGDLQMESDGTDLKTAKVSVSEDDGGNSKTVLQTRYDYATGGGGRTTVLDKLYVDNTNAANTGNSIQVAIDAISEDSHTLLSSTMDYTDLASGSIPANMRQEMLFKFAGDNLNGGEDLIAGEILANANKSDELDTYMSIATKSSNGDAKSELRVYLEHVAPQAPVKLYEISAGSTLPGSPEEGDWFFDTAVAGSAALKRYDGGSWATISHDGAMFYDRTNHRVCVNINGVWKPVSVGAAI